MGDLHPVGKRALIFEMVPCFHRPSSPPPFLTSSTVSLKHPFFRLSPPSPPCTFSPPFFFTGLFQRCMCVCMCVCMCALTGRWWGWGVVGSAPAVLSPHSFHFRWSVHSHPLRSASLVPPPLRGFTLVHSLTFQNCLVLHLLHQIGHVPAFPLPRSYSRCSCFTVLCPQSLRR